MPGLPAKRIVDVQEVPFVYTFCKSGIKAFNERLDYSWERRTVFYRSETNYETKHFDFQNGYAAGRAITQTLTLVLQNELQEMLQTVLYFSVLNC